MDIFFFSFTKPPDEMGLATLTLKIALCSEMSNKCFALRTHTIIIWATTGIKPEKYFTFIPWKCGDRGSAVVKVLCYKSEGR